MARQHTVSTDFKRRLLKYVTSPLVAWIIPQSASIRVVLPAPFAPISAVAKPFGIFREKIGYCASSGFFPQAWKAKDIAISMELAYDSFDRKKFEELCGQLEVDTEHTKKARAMYKQSDGNRMRTALAAVFAREIAVV